MFNFKIITFTSIILLLLLSQTIHASEPTSIGFADPSDISNLVEYRLPDWSYRVWDADFYFNGAGLDKRRFGENISSSRLRGELSTQFDQNWVSELRLMEFRGNLSSNYFQGHSEDDIAERKYHELRWRYDIASSIEQYIFDSPFVFQLSASSTNRYSETVDSQLHDGDWEDEDEYSRSFSHTGFAGFGVGRLRNVVPLLRAQRLSERLTSMGREPLTGQQITGIAHVFSTQYAYREVFDRSDRYFWEDVFAPMMDESNPLTPFEIFYLTDVLNENLGTRQQGFSCRVGFHYGENHDYRQYSEIERHESHYYRSPMFIFGWYHNLSLNHQVSVDGHLSYNTYQSNDRQREDGGLGATLNHLWNVADRYSLNTSLMYEKHSDINLDYRTQSVDFRTSFLVYLQDKISLNTGIGLSYYHNKYHAEEIFSWQWSYRLGLSYHIDRALF